MSKDEFYIGWQDEMPPSNKRFIRRILVGAFVLIPILVFGVVSKQKQFNHHHFEFGTISELTGIYHEEPVPILEVAEGDTSEFVLLVGFGKFGAEEIISDLETEHGELDGKEVTFKGTRIYGDGVTLLELTNREESFVKINPDFTFLHKESMSGFYNETLSGEILDPKCYFGVMKPGEGKIHKSCAIRCISGGIPPVMRVLQEDGINYDYYLVKGTEGEQVNKEILPYIAETVLVSGMSSFQNGWKVINIDLESIRKENEHLQPNR